MSASVFSEKLDEIPSTVERTASADHRSVVSALRSGQNRLAFAVGSGGSAVSAAYLARCRSTLGYAPTVVLTPEAFVLELGDLRSSEVWIFSAGGRNTDALAAFEAALSGKAEAIHVVTSSPHSLLVAMATDREKVFLHLFDVPGRKDGFLATHSLAAALCALAIGADLASPEPLGEALKTELHAAALARLSHERRQSVRDALVGFSPDDCLLLISDPRLGAAATLIETSLWESAICPVQKTDFRNFAHGRHVWPAVRAERSFLLSLTGADTRKSWETIVENLSPLALATLDYKDCGRFQSFLAILDGFAVVEVLGDLSNIDPGRPKIGPNASNIYDGRSLLETVQTWTPAIRQKMKAHYRRDDPIARETDWAVLAREFKEHISGFDIGGVILDFDGTMIPSEDPLGKPAQSTMTHLLSLVERGIRVAIATGRGGSLGETLRPLIPERYWDRLIVGYYNGAYLQPLSVDIAIEPPVDDPAISEMKRLLAARPELFSRFSPKSSHLQLSFEVADIHDLDAFRSEFTATHFGGDADLQVLTAGRMIDIVRKSARKTRVIEALRRDIGSPEVGILCIGDSGGRSGNDHLLLGHSFGVSVGQVCDRPGVCWSFFGDEVTGPEALDRVLGSLRKSGEGRVRLDLSLLIAGAQIDDVVQKRNISSEDVDNAPSA